MCQPGLTSPSYLGPLPDDVLDLVGLVSKFLEAQRLHSGRERVILKQALPLKAFLSQCIIVLAVEADGLVQSPFPVSSFSLPDQPVTEKARRCIWHLYSADFCCRQKLDSATSMKNLLAKRPWHKSKQLISDWLSFCVTSLSPSSQSRCSLV